MATNSYVQVPPDSTGKKLFAQQHTVGADTVQGQVFHLADAKDPTNLQSVDAQGQAFMRFAEGSPTMDAFGNLRVSEESALGVYDYASGDSAGIFQDSTLLGGSVTYVPQASETVLAVPSTNGAYASRTTNRHHYYQPGVGNKVIQTLALSDEGKVGNTRRWGYYTATDGIFWELEGTTMYVVIRSSTTGAVIDTKIPQASWNGDKLDGTGISNMDLLLSKANFYAIDFAWLGVGEVRMLVLGSDGTRWLAHVFNNPNSNLGAYMQSGSQPLRWENFNTATTSGSSELKTICAAVYAESKVNYTFWRFSDIERTVPVEVTTNTPILSMKVAPGSRVGVYPSTIDVFVTSGNVKLTIVDDAVLTGATWSITGEGIALGDIGATSASLGARFTTHYVSSGVTTIDISRFYETNDEGYHRLADDSDSYTFNLLATKLDGTSVTLAATLTYRELR